MHVLKPGLNFSTNILQPACHEEDIIDIGNPSFSGYPEKYHDIRKCEDIQKL